MKGAMRGTLMFVGLLIAAVLLITFIDGVGGPATSPSPDTDPSYTGFLQAVKEDRVEAVNIMQGTGQVSVLNKGSAIDIKYFPKKADYRFYVADISAFYQDIRNVLGDENLPATEFGFKITVSTQSNSNFWLQMIPTLLLMAGVVVVFVMFIRAQNNANNKAMGFGKMKGGPVQLKNRVTFNDVAGADEEKEELKEIVDFLTDPKRYTEMGARIPKGLLLVGPPGTGKTLLARAIAGEAGVPFFSISGSDFVEMFVGVGASRVRDLFDKAKRNAPCIIFIDEIDAVGRQRGSGLGGGHDEREQTLNQLLVEMDGFTHNEGIIMIAATNRPDILDPALLRPGRFDRRITVQYPDVDGREAILKVHARGKPLADDVDLALIARMTPWMTGADLENVLNEAALLAARTRQKKISMACVREAIDRVEMGPEKKSRKVTEEDRRLVATHEAGHAVVAHLLPGCDPVKLVTIVPRGEAGGYTLTVPEVESNYISRSRLLDRIAMGMGGHAAELVSFGDVSTGATGDLKSSTSLARRMVTEFGMSESIGPVYLAGEGEVFVGRDITTQRNVSEEVSARIDEEMKRILVECYRRAEGLIRENADALKRVVDALLIHEKLDGNQFERIMNGEQLDAPSLPQGNHDAVPAAPEQPAPQTDAPAEQADQPSSAAPSDSTPQVPADPAPQSDGE
nr:ATP-dependent zinc metalloprotease FtsH [bacterium]